LFWLNLITARQKTCPEHLEKDAICDSANLAREVVAGPLNSRDQTKRGGERREKSKKRALPKFQVDPNWDPISPALLLLMCALPLSTQPILPLSKLARHGVASPSVPSPRFQKKPSHVVESRRRTDLGANFISKSVRVAELSAYCMIHRARIEAERAGKGGPEGGSERRAERRGRRGRKSSSVN
jgi:hypothetical protein